MTKLLDNVSVNTDGEPVRGDGAGKNLSIWATDFGSGTVTIQVSPDNKVTWTTVTYGGNLAEFTSATEKKITKIGQGQWIRATLTSANGSTSNVNAEIFN